MRVQFQPVRIRFGPDGQGCLAYIDGALVGLAIELAGT
jgi:hypothetical protein